MPRSLAYSIFLLLLSACDDDPLAPFLHGTTNCGTLDYELGNPNPCPDAARAFACFESEERPHVVQVANTDEGDPIYEHFLVEEDGTTVSVLDTRQDDFGAQEVVRTVCSDVILTAGGPSCPRLYCEP